MRYKTKATQAKIFGFFDIFSDLQRSNDNDTPSLQSASSMSQDNSVQLEVLKVLTQTQKDMKKLYSKDNDDDLSDAGFRSKK